MGEELQGVGRSHAESLNSALARNIDALQRRQSETAAQASLHERMAGAITRFAGSFTFVYLHLAIVAVWTLANLGFIPALRPWDPTFVILATAASVEAIFLSTFVMISQNRMAQLNESRAQLDLQVSLLAEHEVTRLIHLTSAIAARLEIDPGEGLEEFKRDIAPEAVLDAIEDSEIE
jgi:uncharacterized membrane protein